MFKRKQKYLADDSVLDANGRIADDILAFLADQGLPATPINFELGYLRRHDAGSIAAHAIEAILTSGARISQLQADQIVGAYRALGSVATPPEPENEMPGQTKLRHQTLHLAELTGAAMTATGQFGRDLSEHLDEMGEDRHGQSFAASITAMIDRTGETERRLSMAMEQIDSLNMELTAARNDAERDALTGLVNRRGLQVHLDALDADACTAIAICDIDRFKTINDRHGHLVGDRVIQAVAESLANSCTPHIVARWGGEEFVVLMEGVPLSTAADIIEAASRNLNHRTFRVRDTGEALDPVTFSAGVVMVESGRANDAIDAADALLYQAKIAGRDRVLSTPLVALAA